MQTERPSLILVRGIPGSGKTTFALTAAQDKAPVFSADDYFMKDGQYIFDGNKLYLAHASCEKRTEDAMLTWKFPVIYVANTFTRAREMTAYFDLADKYGYNIFTIVVENRHGSDNIHSVPKETLSAMKERFSIQL